MSFFGIDIGEMIDGAVATGLGASALGLAAADPDAIFGKSLEGKVPKFKSTNAAKQQKEAIKGNLRSFGKAKKLSSKVNVFNQAELEAMLREAIPQYQKMMNAGSARSMDLLTNESFASMLRGEIPQDAQDAITNSEAGKAISGGYAGGGMESNTMRTYGEARTIGLTSLDLIKRGAELTAGSVASAERWMTTGKALAVPAQHNVDKMFLSSQDYVANDRANQENQWTRNWLSEQVDAMPDPGARGMFDTLLGMAGMVKGGAGYRNYNRGGVPAGGPTGGAPAGGGWNNTPTGAANNSYLPQNNAPNYSYGGGMGASDTTGGYDRTGLSVDDGSAAGGSNFMSPWF